MSRWTGRQALPWQGWFGIGATLLVVLTIAGIVRWHQAQFHQLLNTDEADYVRAAQYGLLANYLGTRERSGFSFTSGVLDEYRRTGWARPFKSDWDAGDASALRHYHPPVALYPVALMSQLGIRDERLLRLTSVGVGAMACLAAVLLAFLLLEGLSSPVRLSISAAAGLLTATSPYHALSSAQIGAHAAYSLVSTLTLASATTAVRGGSNRWWIATSALLGLSILTVPYWALLVPTVLWVWWQGSPSRSSMIRRMAQGLAALALTMLVAWPPFLVGAAFVKPILMYAGIMVRVAEPGRTDASWMLDLARSHVLLVFVGVLGLLAWPALTRERMRLLVPTALFVSCFALLSLQVSFMKPLYASDIIAPLAALVSALAGLAIARHAARAAPVLSSLLPAAILLAGVGQLGPHPRDVTWRAVVTELDERFAGRRILVTPRAAGSMTVYYLPRTEVVLDSNHPQDAAALDAGISSKEIDAILRWGRYAERGGVASRVISTRSPDGKADIDGTTLSWWLNDR